MVGAIIGDIVGSAYEFNPTNDYSFELFPKEANFTDDTVCTIAVADALLRNRDFGESLHDVAILIPREDTEVDLHLGYEVTIRSHTIRSGMVRL